jgi:RNA polymerase sigma-70 factor (ECF subfamily)
MVNENTATESFTSFVKETEPRLKVALIAAFGREVGVEATADALAYGWEHWNRIRGMKNPAGYLWTVGRNRARRLASRSPKLFESVVVDRQPWAEPGLVPALEKLSEKQRVTVLLVHGFEWRLAEVADLMGVSVSTVQKHTERAMRRLRRSLRTES